jgi:hypothetical protein
VICLRRTGMRPLDWPAMDVSTCSDLRPQTTILPTRTAPGQSGSSVTRRRPTDSVSVLGSMENYSSGTDDIFCLDGRNNCVES